MAIKSENSIVQDLASRYGTDRKKKEGVLDTDAKILDFVRCMNEATKVTFERDRKSREESLASARVRRIR